MFEEGKEKSELNDSWQQKSESQEKQEKLHSDPLQV